MDIDQLYIYFDEYAFKALRGKGYYHTPQEGDRYRWDDPDRPETEYWETHDIVPSEVLSQKTLIKQIVTNKTEKGPHQIETVRVYVCYNWKLKIEFVLVSLILETTFSRYTPQYGKDDNYPKRTRCDYQYLAFSVEAFKRLRPELAGCLESL